jgi:hypothetical protein
MSRKPDRFQMTRELGRRLHAPCASFQFPDEETLRFVRLAQGDST